MNKRKKTITYLTVSFRLSGFQHSFFSTKYLLQTIVHKDLDGGNPVGSYGKRNDIRYSGTSLLNEILAILRLAGINCEETHPW